MMMPYPIIEAVSQLSLSHARVEFKINGCLSLQKVEFLVQNSTGHYTTFTKLPTIPGYCNHASHPQTTFTHDVPLRSDKNNKTSFKIKFLADQDFLVQTSPEPRLPPQTSVVQSRDPNSVLYKLTIRSYILVREGEKLAVLDELSPEIRDDY